MSYLAEAPAPVVTPFWGFNGATALCGSELLIPKPFSPTPAVSVRSRFTVLHGSWGDIDVTLASVGSRAEHLAGAAG